MIYLLRIVSVISECCKDERRCYTPYAYFYCWRDAALHGPWGVVRLLTDSVRRNTLQSRSASLDACGFCFCATVLERVAR